MLGDVLPSHRDVADGADGLGAKTFDQGQVFGEVEGAPRRETRGGRGGGKKRRRKEERVIGGGK